MDDQVYTHAMWRVRPGQEDEFIRAWSALADAFADLPRRPTWGALIQSTEDPTLFFSFGPWASLSDAAAMRADPGAQQAIARVRAHCTEATPGVYHLVRHVRVPDAGSPAPGG